MFFQRTIKDIISSSGVGLHSGKKVTITFKPAPANTGIVFIRSDIKDNNIIKLNPSNVKNTTMATVIANESDISISTVEHVLSSCYGLSIDNLYIEVDQQEIPIMDGSSTSFAYLLKSAKIISQKPFLRKWLKIEKTIRVEHEGKWAQISPYNGFKLKFTIDFNHPALNKSPKTFAFDFATQSYDDCVSKARTFGFAHEIEQLRSMGLARGGSVDNVIVLDEYKILNYDTMRYEDEFVRHKVLDAIGDLFVGGYFILGSYEAFKSGHHLNNLLLKKIFNEQAYTISNFENEQEGKINWLADNYINIEHQLNFN